MDAALEKLDKGSYGLCETCQEPIESERLNVDPLLKNCIDHLTSAEQRVLERDLDLAYQIQNALLPKQNLSVGGWTTAYHYEAAGPVSGDYCDLIVPQSENGSLLFLLGDVSGKGVAASILMSHLHAIFRSLAIGSLPVSKMVEQVFCQGTMSTHFATLVCGRADSSGEVEVCNAGHSFPLLLRGDKVESIPATGLPIGMFCAGDYSSERRTMAKGDSLIIYSDGLSEAQDRSDTQYGEERLSAAVSKLSGLSPQELIRSCLEDLNKFRSGARKTDDLTLMVIQRLG